MLALSGEQLARGVLDTRAEREHDEPMELRRDDVLLQARQDPWYRICLGSRRLRS